MTESDKYLNLSISTGLLDDTENWWLPIDGINAVLQLNKEMKAVNLFRLEGSQKYHESEWKIRKVIEWNDSVFLFSKYSYRFWVLRKNTINIEYHSYGEEDSVFITDVCRIDGRVYVFCDNYDRPIKCINLDTMESIEIFYENADILGKSSMTRIAFDDQHIYFCNREPGNIYLNVLEVNTNRIDSMLLDEVSYVNCIAIDGKSIWILGKSKGGRTELLNYGVDGQLERSLDITHIIKLPDTIVFTIFGMIILENRLFLLPPRKAAIFAMDTITGDVREYRNIDKYKDTENTETKEIVQNDFQIIGKELIVYSPHRFGFQVYNYVSNEYRDLNIPRDELLIRRINDIFLEVNNCCLERKDYNINDYLSKIR